MGEKNRTRNPEGKNCTGFSRNCEKGLRCKKNCKKGEKCTERICIVPLALGEDCKLPEGGLSRNCGKGLKCSKKDEFALKRERGGRGKARERIRKINFVVETYLSSYMFKSLVIVEIGYEY